MLNSGQATERPLFPGFLASLLWLTGQDLKITLGIIVQLTGIGLYLSAQEVRRLFGALSAGLFASLLYFYVLSFAGYTLSELLGFMAGCLGFTIILQAAAHHKYWDLLLGMAILIIGISARPGAFFIFPLLAIWIGWCFREKKSFDWKRVVYTFLLLVVLFLLFNLVYSRFLDIPPGSTFGNFSYTIYGQVRGGTGWHSAIADLGTRRPEIVYRAALDFFLDHPLSLAIGFAKSYRDFFWYGDGGVFYFPGQDWRNPLNVVLWPALLFLLVYSLLQMFKGVREDSNSLLLAGFTGIFLSIPFLPPIDGGSRFHAATMPFFFAMLVAGLRGFPWARLEQRNGEGRISGSLTVSRYTSIIFLVAVLLAPLVIYRLSAKPAIPKVVCPLDEQPFVIEAHPGSYIDLIPDKSAQCGSLPEVCLDDFENHNVEITIDDFYQKLVAFAGSEVGSFRLTPALNLVNNDFRYFMIPVDKLSRNRSVDLIAGCGVESSTRNQSIFEVKSVLSNIE